MKRSTTLFRTTEVDAKMQAKQKEHEKKETPLLCFLSCATQSEPACGGSEGIRTLVPLEAVTAFRVRAVMTTSIRFQINRFCFCYDLSGIAPALCGPLCSLRCAAFALRARLKTTSLVCALRNLRSSERNTLPYVRLNRFD